MNNFQFVIIVLLLAGLGTTTVFFQDRNNIHDDHQAHNMSMDNMSMEEHREHFIAQKGEIIGTLIAEGNYACCLEKPCTYCIEKSPKHGEGATCTCLEDVVNGVHPCGECIGEILEGHGNKFLASYFAKAIAEEVGEQHLETLEQIISEKYSDS